MTEVYIASRESGGIGFLCEPPSLQGVLCAASPIVHITSLHQAHRTSFPLSHQPLAMNLRALSSAINDRCVLHIFPLDLWGSSLTAKKSTPHIGDEGWAVGRALEGFWR